MGLWDDFYKTQTQQLPPAQLAQPTQQGHYQTPKFDDLYGAYNKTQSQPAQGEANPIMQLIAHLLTPQQAAPTQPAGNNFASMISALRNDPVGDANKTMSLPSYAPGSASPFNTGFFKSAQERAQIERDRLGVNGYTGRRLAAGLPGY